jgi:phosphatidylglycerol:prolipoprotein diacylglycerol transferase
MLPVLQVGPLAIQFPGLIMLAGIWLAILAAEHAAPRRGLIPDQLSDVVLISLVAGIVGARLGYALHFLDLYLEQPLALLALNPNTLSVFEGFVVGILASLVFIQRKQLALLPVLDALTPGIAVFAIAMGIAHLASGDAFGAPSSLPWSIELWGARRHPSQVYETLAASLMFWIVLRVQEKQVFQGFLFTSFIALQATARLILEAFRGDSLIIAGSLRAAQLVSLVVLVASLLILHFLSRGIRNPDETASLRL